MYESEFEMRMTELEDTRQVIMASRNGFERVVPFLEAVRIYDRDTYEHNEPDHERERH